MFENYFISFIDSEGNDWCIMESTDYDYLCRVFEDMSAPPEYRMESRGTNESVDTCLTWEVLRYAE